MNEYKYYALVIKSENKIVNLVMTPKKPVETEEVEVLELTCSTFCDLAYGEDFNYLAA